MIEKAFPASQLWTLSPENHSTRYYICTGGLIHQKTSATSSFQWAVAPQRSCTPSSGGCRSRLSICQLNQFNTNSEAAMLSSNGPFSACWHPTEQTNNQVSLVQACSWPVRRKSFAIVRVSLSMFLVVTQPLNRSHKLSWRDAESDMLKNPKMYPPKLY